ncbi:MAG: phosphate signaling complex protein PhoU [Synergistaceae bacterium]|nr:phosphate signaling complex protein PhoU [Synergistaceae bacterium]
METINTRKRIEDDLSELKRMIFRMGRMAGESLEKAVWALKNRDAETARTVLDSDDMIDDLEDKIDSACMEFAARYQPLGEDLRVVTSIMHMAVDLERIGDYGGNIAKVAIELASSEPIKPLIDIPRMVEKINRMMDISLTAIDTHSPETAMTVFPIDDEVDDLEKQIMRELFLMVMEKPERLEQSFMLLNVSRTLERAGDHVTNVAERIAYMYTGKTIKASQYRRKRES